MSDIIKVLVISDYRDTLAARPEAELMIRLTKEPIKLTIVTYPGTQYEQRFMNAGITVHLNHPKKKFDRTFIAFLRDLTRECAFDIFYLFNSQAIINGIQAAKKLSVKVLLYRGYTGHINWYDPTAYLKYLHPRVDKIICLAKSIQDYLESQLFFKSAKAITINKGHDPRWYENVSPLDLSEFNIPAEAFVVACMGNARTFKGIKYLLKATYLLSELNDLYLLLIGRDMTKGTLQQLISGSPMHERIIATGWRQDALAILASIDVFVLPSIGGEATTKSLLEAMSMGCAPIATNISGNRGVVVDHENGLEVPTKDPAAIAQAIKLLYLDRSKVEEFGIKAKQHVATKFHIERTVKETRQLFQGIVS